MNPKKWGPQFWFLMHSTSLDYPDKPTESDKKHYKKFYKSFKYVLPCTMCRSNYAKHLLELPLSNDVLSSRKNLFLWTVKMHNKVNKATNKKDIDPAYVLKKYSKKYDVKLKL